MVTEQIIVNFTSCSVNWTAPFARSFPIDYEEFQLVRLWARQLDFQKNIIVKVDGAYFIKVFRTV